jgi:putative ABC transport system permease protein
MFFLLGAVIINMQYSYLTNKDLGFDKRNKILIKTNEMFGRHIDENSLRLYRDELKKNSMVKNASLSDMILGGNERIVSMSGFDFRGSSFFSYIFNIDEGANGTIGLKLKQGHMFSNDSSSDTTNTVIVNEAFVKAMGTTNALNETIGFLNKKQKTIIGIVKDFNYKSLKEKVSPIIFTNYKKLMTECLYVQYQTKDIQSLLSYMKTTWNKYFPDMAFKYSFLDERMENLYSEERKWKDIISYTSIIAVALACMGLFGMTLFSIQKRTKEIGIRKILGATAGNISIMLSKQFIALVVISDLIACPAAYYFMNKWLQDFEYRINISWWIFVLSGVAALLIAILTVCYQAIKAATANPVEALRYE